jgi:hypothetical protein
MLDQTAVFKDSAPLGIGLFFLCGWSISFSLSFISFTIYTPADIKRKEKNARIASLMYSGSTNRPENNNPKSTITFLIHCLGLVALKIYSAVFIL